MVNELPAFTLDEILDGATLAEDTVSLCLNGKLRREYEAVKARIAERADLAEAAATVAAAARTPGDDRLATRDPGAAEPYVDEEQGRLDELVAEMHRYMVTFVIRAVDSQRWNELVEAHPPRKDPATGRRAEVDFEGVNQKTFYPELLRLSIAEPEMTDAQHAKLRTKLTAAQVDKLSNAAKEVNRRDEDIPF